MKISKNVCRIKHGKFAIGYGDKPKQQSLKIGLGVTAEKTFKSESSSNL